MAYRFITKKVYNKVIRPRYVVQRPETVEETVEGVGETAVTDVAGVVGETERADVRETAMAEATEGVTVRADAPEEIVIPAKAKPAARKRKAADGGQPVTRRKANVDGSVKRQSRKGRKDGE